MIELLFILLFFFFYIHENIAAQWRGCNRKLDNHIFLWIDEYRWRCEDEASNRWSNRELGAGVATSNPQSSPFEQLAGWSASRIEVRFQPSLSLSIFLILIMNSSREYMVSVTWLKSPFLSLDFPLNLIDFLQIFEIPLAAMKRRHTHSCTWINGSRNSRHFTMIPKHCISFSFITEKNQATVPLASSNTGTRTGIHKISQSVLCDFIYDLSRATSQS